jgi:hypothetical protein
MCVLPRSGSESRLFQQVSQDAGADGVVDSVGGRDTQRDMWSELTTMMSPFTGRMVHTAVTGEERRKGKGGKSGRERRLQAARRDG